MIYLRTYRSGSRQNERKTLTKAVRLGDLASRIANPNVRGAVAKFTYHPPVHLWDFGVRASERLEGGDVVYILCEDTLYYSKIFEKIEDPNGEIGDLVEWHRIQQAPWKNPMVLKPLVALDSLAPAVHTLATKRIEENFFQLQPSS
ncbi:MAG: hypothetical protein IPN63_01885 [Gammaproteobacteria bacterium]|nr:hypothetical protein [Gammaproteobacteria bacterium]